MARRRTVKEVDSDVKGLRQELLRLKDEVEGLKQVIARHIFGPVSGVLYCYNSKCKGHKWKMTSIELDAGSKEVTA